MVKLGSREDFRLYHLGRKNKAEKQTRVGFNVGVYVCLGWEVGWVACVVDRIRGLIHSDPVDRHSYREG